MSWLQEFLQSLSPEAQSQFMAFYGGGQESSPVNPIANSGTAASPVYNYNYNNNPYGGINPNAYAGDDKEGASRLFADIIRAQTEDYLNRFAPIEDFLAGTITRTGTTFLEGDMERTREQIMAGGLSAQGQYNRNLERYGVTAPALNNTNATTSALVGGLNDTRERDEDRKLALLGGGLGSIAPKIRSSQGANG